jgi:YHS domain-containing protein
MTNRGILVLTAALALSAGGAAQAQHAKPAEHGKAHGAKGALMCPVMKSAIKDKSTAPHLRVNFEPVYVCCPDCIEAIKKTPAKYVKQTKDPVTGKPFTVTAKSPKMGHDASLFLFSSHETHKAFHANPGKYHPQHSERGDQHAPKKH